MKVKLISFSQPTKEVYEQGLENVQDLIAFCARVSNPGNQSNKETANRLIKYLAKHKHWSPFELVSACVEIETTRDIARQILRHRSFSFQEFSQRYADPVKELEFETRDARLQDERNRQNSVEIDRTSPAQRELDRLWQEKQQHCIRTAREAYEWAVSNGIAKEQARAVLPEGNTVSRLYMNGTIRSWLHYIDLRSANGTQKEHMEIAFACAAAIAAIFPSITEYVQQ